MRPRSILLRSAIGGACVVAVAIAGCSGHGSTGAPATTSIVVTTPTTSPATTAPDPDAADKAAITKLYKDWANLNRQLEVAGNDGTDPRIRDYLAGDQLAFTAKAMKSQIQRGEHVRFPTNSAASSKVLSVKVDGASASFKTCEVDDAIVETGDGTVLNDKVTTFVDSWTAEETAHGWRLTSSKRVSSKQGVQDCGHAS